MTGVMHSTGVLENNELTEAFINATVERYKEIGKKGFAGASPFPCQTGKLINPIPGLIPDDLENREKYPEFYSVIMNTYRDVARALDVQGSFSLPPPFIDPFALSVALNIPDIDFNILDLPIITLPELALIFDLSPLEFGLKVPPLLIPEVPPKFNIPEPKIDLSINLPPNFDQKFQFDLWALKLPKVAIEIALSLLDPKILLNLFPIPDPCFAIEKAIEKQMFGPSEPGDFTKVVAVQDLSTFTGQAAIIAATAKVIGDGGRKGATGFLADYFKFAKNPPKEKGAEDLTRVRKKFLNSLRKYMGPENKWGTVGKEIYYSGRQSVAKPGAHPNGKALWPTYTPGPAPEGIIKGSKVTTCGMLPAAVFSDFVKEDPNFDLSDITNPDNISKLSLVPGPQGVYITGKYARAYVPAKGDVIPKSGDIYFVGNRGKNDVTHIGIISDVKVDGGKISVVTADAGQGPASNQQTAWVRKSYHPDTRTLVGDNGEGANLQSSNPSNTILLGWVDLDKLVERAYKKEYMSAWKPNSIISKISKTKLITKIWNPDFVLEESANPTQELLFKSWQLITLKA